ncbi:MAG TPA: hypothetical protein VIH37_02370 [Candidatus Limnocylindrales bacterium]
MVLLRSGVLALGAVLMAGALAGALVAGGVFQPRRVTPQPAPDVTMSPVPSATSPAPSATASEKPATGLVAYTIVTCAPGSSSGSLHRPSQCTSTSSVAATDGGGARELPGEPVGWSADGSRLLVVGQADLVVTDPTGGTLAAFPTWCPDKPPSAGTCVGAQHVLCTYPCAGADGFALSPDGTRVAFVRGYPDAHNASVVAILDLASGSVTELASTRTTNPPVDVQCNKVNTCQGGDENPRWSPDGRRIAFDRQGMSPDAPRTTWTSAALFVVDADGGNLHRVTPTGMVAFDPNWSPDGTRLGFTNEELVANAAHTSVVATKADIYTVGADGSDLTRLTNDGISARPGWTFDGRVTFMRSVGPTTGLGDAQAFENWVMDASGGGLARTGGSLAELTAARCTSCIYPLTSSNVALGPYRAYWQPTP